MRFGLDVAQQRMSWDENVSRVQFAEELGFDGVWGFDHFQPMYGEGPGECFEAMTTVAAWAGATSRIRLGVMVAGFTYRHPAVYAAEALTIDHASHGRLELSYGASWFAKEHHELGLEFLDTPQRIDAFEEAVQIVKGLLTTDGFTFEGRYFQVRNATLNPKPVQQPLPLWIGASGEKRMMPIAARYADVWHCGGSTQELIRKARLMDELCEKAGRDPATLRRASSLSLEGSHDEIAARIEALEEAGFSYLMCGWPPQGRPLVEAFAERFLD
ncbi:MAG TPA: LLM class flavin-dependent oxidoreductase [Acidimicrobiia bacterium]|jgi:alkanesulfonate monooxygenase SsuD/methylene tetrahydromethanopterin reductase-like flavin-dependent oxidoreductase (luciferase family)